MLIVVVGRIECSNLIIAFDISQWMLNLVNENRAHCVVISVKFVYLRHPVLIGEFRNLLNTCWKPNKTQTCTRKPNQNKNFPKLCLHSARISTCCKIVCIFHHLWNCSFVQDVYVVETVHEYEYIGKKCGWALRQRIIDNRCGLNIRAPNSANIKIQLLWYRTARLLVRFEWKRFPHTQLEPNGEAV